MKSIDEVRKILVKNEYNLMSDGVNIDSSIKFFSNSVVVYEDVNDNEELKEYLIKNQFQI